MTIPSIPEEAIYPRDEEHRYRLYARHGDELEVLAVGPRDSIGAMIVQLDEDERERGRRLVDLGAIGLLDAVAGRWLIMPWHRSTFMADVFARAAGQMGDWSPRAHEEYR